MHFYFTRVLFFNVFVLIPNNCFMRWLSPGNVSWKFNDKNIRQPFIIVIDTSTALSCTFQAKNDYGIIWNMQEGLTRCKCKSTSIDISSSSDDTRGHASAVPQTLRPTRVDRINHSRRSHSLQMNMHSNRCKPTSFLMHCQYQTNSTSHRLYTRRSDRSGYSDCSTHI